MPLGAKDAEFGRVAVSTRPIQRKGLRVTELLLLMSDKPCRLSDMGKPHKAGLFLRAFIHKGSRGSILINLIYGDSKMTFKQVENEGMSWLVGAIEADYQSLVNTFGEPNSTGDDYKVSCEWVLRFEDGTYATIYDWKVSKKYRGDYYGIDAKDNTDWHIGGTTERAVDLVTLELLGVTA